jgi:hypothetical protein
MLLLQVLLPLLPGVPLEGTQAGLQGTGGTAPAAAAGPVMQQQHLWTVSSCLMPFEAALLEKLGTCRKRCMCNISSLFVFL